MMIKVKKRGGFQSLPKDKKKSIRVVTYLSIQDHKKLLDYCKGLDTKPSVLIRERLNDILGNA